MQTETPTRQPNLLPQLAHTRNPGMALDLDWVANVQVNTSAVERRTGSLGGRRSVKKEFQADHALGRRHGRPGQAALRQGPPAGAA
jgi:deoxyribose-phosphate aldolase